MNFLSSFLTDHAALHYARTPKSLPDQKVFLSLDVCRGWGICLHATAQGIEGGVLFFIPDRIIAKNLSQNLGVSSLLNLDPLWILPILKRILYPFEKTFGIAITCDDFYFQQVSLKLSPCFSFYSQEETIILQIFLLKGDMPLIWKQVEEWPAQSIKAEPYLLSLFIEVACCFLDLKKVHQIQSGEALFVSYDALLTDRSADGFLLWNGRFAKVHWDLMRKQLVLLEICKMPENTPKLPVNSVLEIPMTVSVVVGEAQLSLDQMIALKEGSIIDQGVTLYDEALLLVNGRPFAKGEVIMTDEGWLVCIQEPSTLELFQKNPSAHQVAIAAKNSEASFKTPSDSSTDKAPMSHTEGASPPVVHSQVSSDFSQEQTQNFCLSGDISEKDPALRAQEKQELS